MATLTDAAAREGTKAIWKIGVRVYVVAGQSKDGNYLAYLVGARSKAEAREECERHEFFVTHCFLCRGLRIEVWPSRDEKRCLWDFVFGATKGGKP